MWKSLADRLGQAVPVANSPGRRTRWRPRTRYLIVAAVPIVTAVITAENAFLPSSHIIIAATLNLIVVSCTAFAVARWFAAHRLFAKEQAKQVEAVTARTFLDTLRAAEEAVRKAKQDKADELSNAAGALVRERKKSEDEREELNQQLAVAVANMSQGLLMFDASARVVVCNGRYIEMYGLSPEIVKPGLALRDLIVHRKEVGLFAGDVTQYCAAILASIKRGKTDSTTIETTDGRTIHIVNQPMAGGGWVSTHEDITERRRAEQEINRTQKFLFKVIENVPAPITVKDARELRYILVNRAGEKFYGVPRTQIIGKTAHEIFPKATADLVVAHDRELLKTKQEMSFKEQAVDTPGGDRRIVLPRRLPVYGEDGEPQFLLGLIDDVTERRKAEAQLARMIDHDPLTDLPNHTAFAQQLGYELDRAKRGGEKFAVLTADLDGIRQAVDMFGQESGDAMLRELSLRFMNAAGGAYLARLYTDRFALIASEGPQPSLAEGLAGQLLSSAAADIETGGRRLNSVLNIGMAIYPDDGGDATTLMSNAATALSRAKAEGPNSVCLFSLDLDSRLQERRSLQIDLRGAIERGELSLYYQPQATVAGEVIGFEALVRWHHPHRGLIPPSMFIPLAEESGSIAAIGEWILREACREAASWPRRLGVAVNISPLQFRDEDLVGMVHRTLLETGLSAGRLELEVTESATISDQSRALSILNRLKSLGVRMAIDDFGTGYSSLSNLHELPFDKVKIDRSFVVKMRKSNQASAIIDGVIAIAQRLRLTTIAEGVETKEELSLLANAGCDEIQGYLIGKPHPISNYGELIGRSNSSKSEALRAG